MRIRLGAARFVVNADLVKENYLTAWVRLFNGDIIKRRKKRDFVDFDVDKKEVGIKTGFWNRVGNFFKTILTKMKGAIQWITPAQNG